MYTTILSRSEYDHDLLICDLDSINMGCVDIDTAVGINIDKMCLSRDFLDLPTTKLFFDGHEFDLIAKTIHESFKSGNTCVYCSTGLKSSVLQVLYFILRIRIVSSVHEGLDYINSRLGRRTHLLTKEEISKLHSGFGK